MVSKTLGSCELKVEGNKTERMVLFSVCHRGSIFIMNIPFTDTLLQYQEFTLSLISSFYI